MNGVCTDQFARNMHIVLTTAFNNRFSKKKTLLKRERGIEKNEFSIFLCCHIREILINFLVSEAWKERN